MQICRQNYMQNCNAKKCAENLANLANLTKLALKRGPEDLGTYGRTSLSP
jgi:hypothetical protein